MYTNNSFEEKIASWTGPFVALIYLTLMIIIFGSYFKTNNVRLEIKKVEERINNVRIVKK